MRKIFASILVLAMALASFSMVAFAAPATDVYFGTEGITTVTATEDTYTVEVYYDPASHMENFGEGYNEYYVNKVEVKTSVTNGTIKNTAAKVGDGTLMKGDDTSNTMISQIAEGDSYVAEGAFKIADITVTRDGDAKTSVLTLSDAKAADYDLVNYNLSAATLTITWPGSEPTEETATFTGTAAYDNFKGDSGDWYLGVWVGEYNVTSGSAAKAIKKISVTFTGDTNHEFVVDKDRNNKDLNISGEGTTTFKIAIVGVPEALKDASVATATIE